MKLLVVQELSCIRCVVPKFTVLDPLVRSYCFERVGQKVTSGPIFHYLNLFKIIATLIIIFNKSWN